MKAELLGSAPNKERIIEVVNKFYSTRSIRLKRTCNEKIFLIENSSGIVMGVQVRKYKNRYRFESIIPDEEIKND